MVSAALRAFSRSTRFGLLGRTKGEKVMVSASAKNFLLFGLLGRTKGEKVKKLV
jgi:hypothetical protein